MIRNVGRVAVVLLTLVSLSLLCAGCSNYGGEVSGRVTMDGKMVQTGHVIITSDNGLSAQGQITDDGTYTVQRPPKGKCKVTVISTPPGQLLGGGGLSGGVGSTATGGKGAGGDETKQPEIPTGSGKKIEYIEIPAKYGDVKSTPFSIDITSSSQTFNIDMKK
jgi:hypothetical protein